MGDARAGTRVMDLPGALWAFLIDPASAVPQRLYEHLYMSAGSLTTALAIALPAGLYIGHTRRGEFVAVSVANIGRALPSFGVLGLVFPFTLEYIGFGSIGGPPTFIALVLLSIPPIVTNTYVGIKGVEPDLVDAALGMGMSGTEVLTRVEVPLGLPLIVAGVRTAAVQVVATASLGALVGWGGLGRYIIDGIQTRNRTSVLAGALLVAVLALAVDLALGVVQRLVSAPPATGAERGRSLRPTAPV